MFRQRFLPRARRRSPQMAARAIAHAARRRAGRGALIAWCIVAAVASSRRASAGRRASRSERASIFRAGANPARVAVADLNGDGRPDLVVSNYAGSSVSVFLGVSPGLFGPRRDYATNGIPIGLAIADLNGDGRPDLVVAALGGVSILLGDGTGGFLPFTRIMPGLGAFSAAVGDLNGDGFPDIVVGVDANPNPGEIGVVLGDGHGGFGPVRLFADGDGEQTESVALGDINGDGFLNVAVTNISASGVAVMLGDGAGGFGPAVGIPSEDNSFSVALTDLDNDGILDYAVASDYSPGGSNLTRVRRRATAPSAPKRPSARAPVEFRSSRSPT